MATPTLDVKIRALVEGLQNVTKLSQELAGTGTAAKTAGADAQEGAAGVGGLDGKMAQAAGSTAEFKSNITALPTPMRVLGTVIGAVVGALGALVAAYGIKESVAYAARTETLGATLNVVARNAGYGGEEISKYEKELKAAGITTQAARQAMTQMIQAGLPLGPMAEGGASSVSKLARAAQDLAVVTGENSSATLTRLITNIQQMDTMGLRYMGLTVNIEAAQQKFALSIGKTADQLTQQQKTQAVLNEAMAQADKLSGAYATSMEMVGKKAQSLKRYQEELANSVGAQLLPSYGAVVDVVTDFLRAAEATISQVDHGGAAARGLADGVKDFFGAVTGVLQTVIQIGAEVYPMLAAVGGQLLSLVGEIIQVIGSIASFGGQVDTANGRVSLLGTVINQVGTAIGILIAGFRDGGAVIVATIRYAMGVVIGTNGLVLESLGNLVRVFNTDLGDAMIAAGKIARGTGQELRDMATETVDRFGRGESALGKFNASLDESARLTKALIAASTYQEVETEINRLLQAKRENTKTDVELKDGTDQIAAAMKRLAAEGKLSEAEIAKLDNTLRKVGSDSRDEFIKALSDIGLSLQQIGSTEHLLPLNKEIGKVTSGLATLAQNANTTVNLFQEAFAKGLDTAKTVGDINAIAASLDEAKKRGWELGESTQALAARFEEVFTASLKAAKTSADYKLLEDQVTAVGDSGRVAGDIIQIALDKIREKASGAREEIERMGQQATAAAQASLTVARAQLGVLQADADVGRARIGVWQAQNRYAREASEVARQALKLAQLSLDLAQAKAELARLQYAQEQQAMTSLIAQQRVLNATTALRYHDGEAFYVASLNAEEKQAQLEKQGLETARQKVAIQQELVIGVEGQIVKQRLAIDQAKATADESARVAKELGIASDHADGLAGKLGGAAGAASTLAENLRSASSAMGQFKSLSDFQAAGRPGASFTDPSSGVTYSKNSAGELGSTAMMGPHGMDAFSYLKARSKSAIFKPSDFTESDLQIAKDQFYASEMNSRAGWNTQGSMHEAQNLITTIENALADKARASDRNTAPAGSVGATNNQDMFASQLLARISRNSSVDSSALTPEMMNSISAPTPSKVVQVNFTNDRGVSVPVTVDAGNEVALLDLLQKAKGVAS